MGIQKNLQLKAARILHGFTQAQLAEKVGRSQTWVWQLENGLIQASDLDVALICRILRVTPKLIFPNPEQNETVSQIINSVRE
jgi:transcriptional regulator with XRE-family HTH domain